MSWHGPANQVLSASTCVVERKVPSKMQNVLQLLTRGAKSEIVSFRDVRTYKTCSHLRVRSWNVLTMRIATAFLSHLLPHDLK